MKAPGRRAGREEIRVKHNVNTDPRPSQAPRVGLARHGWAKTAAAPERNASSDPLELLRLIHPDRGIFSVCAFGPPGGARRHRFFTEPEEAYRFALRLDRDDRFLGVYFGIAELRKDIRSGRGKESDVVAARAAWADIDAKDETGNRHKDLARQCLASAVDRNAIPPPSAVVDSGGGFHVYFLLVEPATEDDLRLLKAVNHRIAVRLGGDATHDLARVLRVPGTRNRKPEYGTVPECRLAELHPERRYALRDLAGRVGLDPSDPEHAAGRAGERGDPTPDIDPTKEIPEAWIAYLADGRRTRARGLWEGTRPPRHDRSRSGFAMALIAQALRAGITDPSEIAAIVRDAPSCRDWARDKPQALEQSIKKVLSQRAEGRESLDRPIIFVSTRIDEVVDEAVAVLRRAETTCGVFQRGGIVCRVTRAPEFEAPWLERPLGAAAIEPLRVESLREKLAEVATWAVETAEGPRPVLVPKWAAETLLARGVWPFPVLRGITATPPLRSDGSLCGRAGYDAATGLWCDLDADTVARADQIPARPDRACARDALSRLAEPLQDFPFQEPADRAACLAAILSIVGRHLFTGPCPLFAIRAPAAGTGKTLLADAISLIATGRIAPRVFPGAHEEEDRKRILALAIEAPPVILLDNIERPFGSPSLSAALTGPIIKDRLLGRSQMLTVPLAAVWVATGNNLSVRGDLARRVIPIDLDAEVEHPEERSDFKDPDLLDHVRRERAGLVAAALTVLRAGIQCRWTERSRLTPFGGFEGWSRAIRALLYELDGIDPCAGRARMREESDPQRDALRALLRAWHDQFGDSAMTARQVIERADALAAQDPNSALRAALPEPPRGRGSPIAALGYFLRRHRGRIVDGLRLETAPGRLDGSRKWRVTSQR